MAERTSVTLRPRDLVRMKLTVPFRTGSDMAETANGWLWRTFQLRGEIIVERSENGGHDWIGGGVPGAESFIASPTLAVDRRDNLWVWFSDRTTCYGYLSGDYGQTWALFAQHPGGGPRMAVGVEDSYLAIHDAMQTLAVCRTTDGGRTVTPIFGQTCPAQVASLEFDRRGVLHLIYKTSDNELFHRHAAEPKSGSFSGAVSWGPGRFQTLAIGTEYSLFARWDGGLLHVSKTNVTCTDLAGSAAVPSGSYTPGYTGIWIDRRGQHWLTPKPAGDPMTSIWSPSLTGWSAP